MSSTQLGTIEETGASANNLVYGFQPSNEGMIIRVLEDQAKSGKQIEGKFLLVKAGTGNYSQWLEEHEGRIVNTKELIGIIVRKENKGKKTLHIFNRNQLKLYEPIEYEPIENVESIIPKIEKVLEGKITNNDFGKMTKTISEANLESLILENLDVLEVGLHLIKSQFDCPGVGRIDILCEDKEGNLVVIELKKFGVRHDSILDQILRYMGYLKIHKAKQDQKVRGIIVVGKLDEKLRYAVSAVSDVTVKTFNLTIQ